MKSFKEMLNNAINKSTLRKLTDEELYEIKKCTLEIYKIVADICEKNNLIIMLGGGSALGSIRHKGFIPWDDDMDLNMPRKDYDKLLILCEKGALGDDYVFSYPRRDVDSPSAFLKIYKKGTKLIGAGGEDLRYPSGIDIDIFPIEGASSNKIVRWFKGIIADGLRLIANLVEESEPWSLELKKFYLNDKKFFVFMKCRQLAGRPFSIISHKRWLYWYDLFVRNPEIRDFCVIPTGRKKYMGETFLSSVFFPVCKGTFEGLEVNLPSDTNAYLKRLYGDYMQIPPIDKRERHLVSVVKFC